jgi:hypothetical protein
VELTARIAAMNLTARTNIALGIRSEEFSAACGLQPLATPSRPQAVGQLNDGQNPDPKPEGGRPPRDQAGSLS